MTYDPTGGVKHDSGKAPWHLLPFDAIGGVVGVLAHGATKYATRNWERGMDWSRPYSALLRHLTAWWGGEEYDPDSGRRHLAHVACNALFLLAYTLRGVGTDDRPGNE